MVGLLLTVSFLSGLLQGLLHFTLGSSKRTVESSLNTLKQASYIESWVSRIIFGLISCLPYAIRNGFHRTHRATVLDFIFVSVELCAYTLDAQSPRICWVPVKFFDTNVVTSLTLNSSTWSCRGIVNHSLDLFSLILKSSISKA